MGQPTQRLKPKPTLTQLTTTADGEVMPGPTDTDGVMEDPTDGDTEDTGRERLRPHLLLMPKLSHGTTATGMEPVPTALTTGEATVTPTAPTTITDGEDTGSVRLVRRSLQADPTPMPAPRLIPKHTGMAPMAAGGEDGDTDTVPMATDTDTGGELTKTDVLKPTNDCFQNNNRPSVTLVSLVRCVQP